MTPDRLYVDIKILVLYVDIIMFPVKLPIIDSNTVKYNAQIYRLDFYRSEL